MKRFLAACFCFLAVGSAAYGDKWTLPPEVIDNEFTFGDTRIVLHYDSTQDRRFPKYVLRVYDKDKRLVEHDGIGFEKLLVSSDNAFFVGVSNSGLIKDAYVVFDRQGRLLKKQLHDPKKVKYHSYSVTLIRAWYDAEKPEAKFEIVDGTLRDLTINAADGKRVSLLDKPAAEKP